MRVLRVRWQHVDHDAWIHVCHESDCKLCIPETVQYGREDTVQGTYDQCFIEQGVWPDDPVVSAYFTQDGQISNESNAVTLTQSTVLEVPEPSLASMAAAALVMIGLVHRWRRRR